MNGLEVSNACKLAYDFHSFGFGVRDLPCAKAGCLVREPDALIAHVRFDEQDVETE